MDGELALGDLELVPRASQLNNRLASDSRKNQTVQRAGDQLSLALLVDPEEEDVHRTSLHDNSVGAHAQDLAVALLFPLVSGQNRRSVVGSQLVGSVTTRPGTHMVLICDQLDRLEAGGVVRTRRRADSVQHASLGWMNAEEGIRGNARGTKVEGVTLSLRNPVLIDTDQLLDSLQMKIRINGLDVSSEEPPTGRHSLAIEEFIRRTFSRGRNIRM